MKKNALILFVRNPVLGKVKTRLAATLGDAAALKIYLFLLEHTRKITKELDADKYIFYADFVNPDDCWNGYFKVLQVGEDLGERMQHAFQFLFDQGYENICIIGSDCYALDTPILMDAFKKLEHNDAVIGPATDGGYYLLGMKKLHAFLFQEITWSSNLVLQQTITALKKNDLSYHFLPELSDVDDAAAIDFDWQSS